MTDLFKLSIGESLFKALNCAFLAILAIISLYPFWYVFVRSVTHPDVLLVQYLWPKDFFYANYYTILATPRFWRAMLISVLRVAVAVPTMLLVTSATAYVLSRRQLLFRKTIIWFFFITMFFSGGLIPHFLTVKTVGLYNTFSVYVIPFMFNVWTMIIMKTSIQSLPHGLVEAALMDGASHMRIYCRIILPLSKAMLAVLGLFSAVGWWNDWFYGAFYVSDSKLMPLQTLLQTDILDRNRGWIQVTDIYSLAEKDTDLLKDLEAMTPDSLYYGFIMVALLPIIILYPFLQKYFSKGVLIGSLKE